MKIQNIKEKIDKINKNIKKNAKNTKIINEFLRDWDMIFAQIRCYNQEINSYSPSEIEIKDYGFSCKVYAPKGLSIFDLEKYKELIESGLHCEFVIDIPQHRRFAWVKIVYPEKVQINKIPFYPVDVKPWEFCAGFDITNKPIIFNINDTPQILIAGQQRRGKNGAVDIAITSWIHSCSPDSIMFYMFQCAKNDLVKYRDCKHVYCYADNLFRIYEALQHLVEIEMMQRTALFEPMVSKADGNDNIFHYNKLHPYSKLPYVIVVIDEFIELMPDTDVDDKDTKMLKNTIMNYLRKIGQWGGSLGVNYCILHQKPEKILMPSFIKNQSSVRICFGFEDLVCCSIVLGDELAKYAHKIPARKAFYSNNEKHGYLYTQDLKGRISEIIAPAIDPKHRMLFSDLKKMQNDYRIIQANKPDTSNKGVIEVPSQQEEVNAIELNIDEVMNQTMNLTNRINKNISFDNVEPKEEVKLIDNSNFVPYVDYSKLNIKVIDQTNITTKTEKPRKENKNQ